MQTNLMISSRFESPTFPLSCSLCRSIKLKNYGYEKSPVQIEHKDRRRRCCVPFSTDRYSKIMMAFVSGLPIDFECLSGIEY